MVWPIKVTLGCRASPCYVPPERQVNGDAFPNKIREAASKLSINPHIVNVRFFFAAGQEVRRKTKNNSRQNAVEKKPQPPHTDTTTDIADNRHSTRQPTRQQPLTVQQAWPHTSDVASRCAMASSAIERATAPRIDIATAWLRRLLTSI